MKEKIEIFKDGSVAYSELPKGYSVETHNTVLGSPKTVIDDPKQEDKELVKSLDVKVELNKDTGKLQVLVVDDIK